MIRRICFLMIGAAFLQGPLPAHADDDEIVRLPGRGQIKDLAARPSPKVDRLIPGGGLILSFDGDRDGIVTASEVEIGISEAFAEADDNADGRLSPLEQAAWAAALPTRDDTLANPARFDPNLDRVVSFEEFAGVVGAFAAGLADASTGDVRLASLKAGRPAEPENPLSTAPQPIAPRRGG